jgi:hypothetical protein
MPSTYTPNNKIEKIGNGEQSGLWGVTTNDNFDLFDAAIDGVASVALTGTTHTLDIPDGAPSDGRSKVLLFTGALAGTNTISITPNTVKKYYFIQNNTTGGQNIVISQGSGNTVTVKPGYSSIVYLDGAGAGASVREVLTSLDLSSLLEVASIAFAGSSSGTTTLQASAVASGTLTLPAATDTIVARSTTDTFSNKTISGSTNTLTNIGNASLVNSSITINGSPVSLGGSVSVGTGVISVETKNSNYTVLTSDGQDVLIRADSSSGPITITLYTAVGNEGKTISVKKTDSSSNSVTINTTSSQTIDGSLTYTISSRYTSVTMVSDGVNWDII